MHNVVFYLIKDSFMSVDCSVVNVWLEYGAHCEYDLRVLRNS